MFAFLSSFCLKNKKDASHLVQCAFNSFIINKKSRKSRRKNEEKMSKINLNSTFFDPFQTFSGTWSIRLVFA